MIEVAIEGLDGSGKTTVAQKLAEIYQENGISAEVASPYRLASAQAGEEIYPKWSNPQTRAEAVRLVHEAIDISKKTAVEHGTKVLIFDRHWMTAFCEIEGDEQAIAQWGDVFVPTAYLRVDPETAQKRAGTTHEQWMSQEKLKHDGNAYNRLCKDYGNYLLGIYRNDDDVSIEALARNIAWDLSVKR